LVFGARDAQEGRGRAAKPLPLDLLFYQIAIVSPSVAILKNWGSSLEAPKSGTA